MPKLLVERLTDDTIRQFRAAARIRNEDAWQLAREGRRAAAVYLWGYVAEMTVKAAWFALNGFTLDRPITPRDLNTAVALAQGAYGIAWPHQGRLHAISHWAELLIRHRIGLGQPYADAAFAATLLNHTRRVYDRWRETLRYKKNQPYVFEVRAVAESVAWLLDNSRVL